MSATIAFGDYKSGHLMAEDELVSTFQCARLIDGSKEHYVTPHVGNRWSLIIFLHNKATELPTEDMDLLNSLGVNIPTKRHQQRVSDSSVSEVKKGSFPDPTVPKGELTACTDR